VDVYAVAETGDVRRLDAFHWGLVPHWAKDLSVGNRMINARAETVGTRNAFRRPFARRRCIVPADGFYEWSKVPGHRKKQPYFIHRTDDEPLAFAGLWEVWRGAKGDAAADSGTADTGTADTGSAGTGGGSGDDRPFIRSCTIITTSANETMAAIHDRMPVILPPSAWDAWLDPDNADLETLGRLLVPAPARLITMHPVSIEVSNVRNKGPHLVEPVSVIDPDGKGAAAQGQGSLLEPNG
jgi:putative SOS response-associated peptidase YedK